VRYEIVLGVGASTLLTFVVGLVVVRALLSRLPTDFFVRPTAERPPLVRVARQLTGALLVVAGLAMLVLPGPGLVAIALGLVLFESPKKGELLRRLLAREGVRRALDGVRARAGKAPFELDRLDPDQGDGAGPERR